MSKSSYLAANVDVTSDSFGGWIGKTNLVIHDMGTVVVTVNDVAQPNTTNGAQTTGNAHIEGIFSATTIGVVDALRGGTVSVPATLDITSNVDFTSTNGTIDITSSINMFNVDANNVVVSSNVVFDGGSTKIFIIDAANTVINSGSLYGKSNTYFSGPNTYITSAELKSTSNTIITGARVDLDGTTFDVTSNTVFTATSLNADVASFIIGNDGDDTFDVNSDTDFNANVNIDGIFTATANSIFSGALVNITSANTTVGDAGTDRLNVNAAADFNANVNIDGILTQTANAVFSGALVNITGANTTVGDAGTDKLNINATSDFNANVNIDGILTQTANAVFTGALVNITGANTTVGDLGTDKLNVNATSDFNANVNIDGILTQTANAVFTGAVLQSTSNTIITGARVDLDGTTFDVTSNAIFTATSLNANVDVMTIGFSAADSLIVNSVSDFNANVNIDGILTQTANAVFTGALVNITGANTTIGNAGTDVLNVNAVSDFNANVNIDGLFTVTNTATFTGAETFFNNNVTLGATIADTVSILGYVDADVLPSATTVDLGSDVKPFGNVHSTYVWSDNNIDTLGDFVVRGSTTRTLKALSTNTGYQTFNLVLETSTANQKLPLVANSTGIHGGANTTYDLGSTAINWSKLYVKDAAVANSAVVSNVLTVNSQANTASLMVRDLTATRVPYVSTGGEIVDSANLVFSGTTLAVTGAATVSTDLSVTGNATVAGTATINTQANTASLMVRDLTPTRIVYAGTGGELVDSSNLTFSGSNLAVTGNTTISANLSVTNVVSAANIAATHVGTSTLGTSGLATLSTLSVTGNASFNGDVNLQDNDRLLIGTANDLQILHDGLNSYIKDSGAGALIVDTSTFRLMNAANTETMILASENGAVSLYHNNIARFATSSSGANVTGTFGVSGLATLTSANVTSTFEVIGLSTLVGNTSFGNNVVISGDLTVLGTTNLATDTDFTVNNSISTTVTTQDLIVNGNTSLGDTNVDIITLNARVSSNIIPSANITYDIGSTTDTYRTVYANNFVGNTEWASVQNKPDPRITVTLSGDVTGTGNATLTDLANGSISISTTIQPNSVALGTDTTGNYMSGVTAGGGITVTHTPGEGSSATIAHTDTSSVANLTVDNSNGTVLQDLSLTFDTYGHVTAISSASVNLDNRYPQVTFRTFTVDDTDTEYTWSETGSAVADSLTDTLTFVGGADIDIDVDATNDAIRIQDTSTLSTVTSRGATTSTAISITNTTESSSTSTGALKVSGGVGVAKNLWVGANTNVAGRMSVTGATTFANNVTIAGDLTVNGTTTTINSTTVTYDDKNLELGSVTSPSDAGADGGGITLKGTTDKTFNWVDATDAWTSSEHMNLVSGKAYYINGTSVLSSTTLGSGVTGSSLTSVGTISTGTWSASTIAVNRGGTGQTSYTNGQLLIGNTTGNTLTKTTLTAGNNITITNGPGTITIAAADSVTNLGYTSATTQGTVTSSTGTNAVIPAANTTVAGLITTGTQTIAGTKTFNNTISGSINGNAATATSATYANDAGGLRVSSGGAFVIDGIAQNTPVNYLQVRAANTAQDVLVTTEGADTNIDLLIQTKGAGSITLDTGTGAGVIDLKPGSSNLRVWDNTSTHYHEIITGDPTANRTLNLPDANVTLVSGTMVPTTGTGATGTWGISVSGNAATVTNGVYTTGDQTIAGTKTFSSTISGSINGNAATATSATYASDAGGLRVSSGGAFIIDGIAQTVPVNYLQVRAANTAQDVLVTTAGSDTNIDLLIQTKGTGSITLDTGTGAGVIDLKPGSSNLRVWDNTSTHYHEIITGDPTANRTLTLPNANVTLVSGTMVPTTGTGATGSWAISVTGNAATATKLATARTIGGVSFDGSANINLPGVNTAGNQNTTGNAATATTLATARTIGGVSFDGSANINLPGVNTAGNQNTSGTAAIATTVTLVATNTTNATHYPLFADAATGNENPRTDTGFTYNPSTGVLTSTTFSGALSGNATTATTLQTARTIGGVSFDGSANINLPGVNTTGNQNTTGSAATLTTARTINGTSFNGSANITTANWGTARTIWGQSINGSANITAPVRPAAGSETVPAFSTSDDTNTGIYFSAADTVNITTGGTLAATFSSGGDFTAVGDITSLSDKRIKTDIQPIEDALQKVMSLSGYTYLRTDIDARQTGVIAQEVLKVLPEAVSGSEETNYTVAYGNMIGLLIQAIKEQQIQIDELKSKLEN